MKIRIYYNWQEGDKRPFLAHATVKLVNREEHFLRISKISYEDAERQLIAAIKGKLGSPPPPKEVEIDL